MEQFDKYEEFQKHYINLLMPLSMCWEEVPPELFAPLADAFLNDFKNGKRLYGVMNNERQALREARYRQRLKRRGWRKRIRDEVLGSQSKALPSSEIGAVKEAVKSEAEAERINSAAVYVSRLDCDNERQDLLTLTEEDSSSAGLTADLSEDKPS